MAPINKEWHLRNKMPARPTPEQRIAWHIEHARNCSCRPIPEKLRLEIAEFEKHKRSVADIVFKRASPRPAKEEKK